MGYCLSMQAARVICHLIHHCHILTLSVSRSLLLRLHSLLFSWIFSPPVIYLILSLYPPLHTQAHTATHATTTQYTQHTRKQCRYFTYTRVSVHRHMQCIYKTQITHTHTHTALLCVFLGEGTDYWAHSYVKDAWFCNCFLGWHEDSTVHVRVQESVAAWECVCVCARAWVCKWMSSGPLP